MDSAHTLSGWRRYAATRLDPEDRPTPGAIDLKGMSERERLAIEEQRLDYHSATHVIETPLLHSLLQETRLLMIANRRQLGARQGVILSGPPTTGKTTALLSLGLRVENVVKMREPQYSGAAVAYISLPPQATPKSIARAIVNYYGINPPPRTTFPELADAAVGFLNDLDTRVIIIDEIHNLTLRSRAGAEASDFLKYLLERVPSTAVYAGVDVEHAGLFDGVRGRQLAGRFVRIEASPFSYGIKEERLSWARLVAAFEETLCLANHKAGALRRSSQYLYTRTSGHIGSLASLIRKSAITAILTGDEEITVKLLETIQIDFAAETHAGSATASFR